MLLIAVYVLTSAAVFVIILNKQVKSAILQSRTCALSAAGTGSLSCGRNYRSLKPANAVYVSHPAVAYRSNWETERHRRRFFVFHMLLRFRRKETV